MGFRQPDKETELMNIRIGNSTNFLIAKRLDFGTEPKYDIREHYTNKDGNIAPGTKGLRVSSETLVDLMVSLYKGMDSAEQFDFREAAGLESIDLEEQDNLEE